MNQQTVYLQCNKPCEPLFSDKCLFWLASTFAAAGHPVKSVADRLEPGRKDIVLTNTTVRGSLAPESNHEVLRLTSSTDRMESLMRMAGRIYGRSRFYHPPSATGASRTIRRLIDQAKKPFAKQFEQPSETFTPLPNSPESLSTEGRNVVFRINVDWDSRGLDLLDRWCERFELHPTLAVAGSEILEHRRRVREFVNRYNVDVASHSYSHYVVLSSRTRERQRREISDNQSFLEDLFSRPVRGFVAPYIKYNRNTFELLEEYGYRWFIRSWMLHPVGLPGFKLLDLGVNFYFSPGWENRLPQSLGRSDLVLQLHLRDLVKQEKQIEWMLEYLAGKRVRFIDCSTFFEQRRGRCFL
jgi:peptidoglycan/xylan/chitin deacetylase (PgdA/CDA1 family)